MRAIHLSQSRAHALSEVSRPGSLHLHGRPRGRLQSGDRDSAQAHRHALDRPRRQRHHRPPLLSPEWSLRGLLGTPRPGEGRVTPTTLMSCARRPALSLFPFHGSSQARTIPSRDRPRQRRPSIGSETTPGSTYGLLCVELPRPTSGFHSDLSVGPAHWPALRWVPATDHSPLPHAGPGSLGLRFEQCPVLTRAPDPESGVNACYTTYTYHYIATP